MKRNIVLINPSFQLKLGLFLALLMMVSVLFYPIIIFDVFTTFSQHADKYLPALGHGLAAYQSDLIIILISWQLGLVLIIFVLSIFFTHRIAGPISKVVNVLQQMRLGKNPTQFSFRKGDYFPELATEVSLLSQKLLKKNTDCYQHIYHTIDQLAKFDQLPSKKDQEIMLKNLINDLSTILQEIE